MKTFIQLVVVLFITTFSACTLHTSNNGRLDGYWHLCSIDTLSTKGTLDCTTHLLFWGVQCDFIEFFNRDLPQSEIALLRFQHKSDSLHLFSPYFPNRENGDIPLTPNDINILRPYGMNDLETIFHIDHLGHNTLTISTPKLRLHFKRF